VLRERAAGTYRSSAYFLAKNIADLVFQVLAPVVFSVTVYFLVGFQGGATKFFIFTGFLVLGSMAAVSLALMISALARSTDMSVTILPMALEVARLFGGFFLAPSNTPGYFYWLSAVSYIKYVYLGLAQNELMDLALTCTQSDIQKNACLANGETRMQALGLDEFSMGVCAAILVAYIVITRAIAYVSIRYIKW
jgi:hypothetical protein